MNTMNHLREGISRAWDALAEGWQELRDRAGQALTRFEPWSHGDRGQEAREGELTTLERASRWSLLAGDVVENEQEVQVRLEVPGMEREDFEVEVMNDMLVVRGEKRLERERQEANVFVMERAFGRFERRIPLPADVDDTAAKATYARGVLTIVLPKTTRGRPRRIHIG